MKHLLVTLFLLISFFGFGQSVTAPEPKSFTINTANQDASGFSLSGFGTTSTLLCAIGLPQSPSGTTFNLTTTTGLTAASGFTMTGNKTRLVFTGTMANINNALATLKINTTGTAGIIQISVSATVNPSGYFYNPNNGHFYRPISSGANFANAITLSSQQTFKGQTGYLVTITSADEDLFIFNNVPQSNIWFAADDRTTEARWVISAGPEVNTLLRIGNASGTNQQGVYNNWAAGEPNDWGGNEDAAVTKWGGGFQWNDLSTANVNPYVVEFGTWTNPDDQTFTEFYSNSVNHSNGDVLRTQFTFDFGSNVDETKFKTKMFTSTDNVNFAEATTSAYRNLNGLGKVDMTTDINPNRLTDGIKATVVTGGNSAEFSYVNISNGVTTLYLDLSRFGSTTPSDVKSVNILDVYNGPVTFQQTSLYWAHYTVPSTLPKVTNGTSSFNGNIRNAGNNNWAFNANIAFSDNLVYRPHHIFFSTDLTATQLGQLYGNIVTVSDVYLAFRELSDKGILGNESKYFTTGIQFDNADVNYDNVFDEQDCYKLLQHLQGTISLWENSPVLPYMMKLIPSPTYNSITKENWSTYAPYEWNRARYPISIVDNSLNSYGVSVSWVGDVNLSHSAIPAGTSVVSNSVNSFKTMSLTTNSVSNQINATIMSENVGGKVIVTITIDPLQQELVGTQFQLNYDNSIIEFEKVEFTTKGTPTNFGTNKGSYITLGSLITDGSTILDKTTEYKITFLPKIGIQGILGLTSISSTDAVNKSGTQLKVKVN